MYKRQDEINARTIHLHPKQVGGAILSIDHMNPKNAWLWAGTNWEKDINKNLVDVLSGVVMQSEDPEQLCMQWEKALGIKRAQNELKIQLAESTINFVESTDGRGEGINAFKIKALNKDQIIKNAKSMKIFQNEEILLGGVKIILE